MGTVMVADVSPNLQSLTTHASLLLLGMLKKVKVKANKTKSNEVDNGSPLNAARNASSTPKESKSESK